MKGFIVVTASETGRRSCIPVSGIAEIAEQSDGTAAIAYRIELSKILKHDSWVGFKTVESFSEVLKKIEEAL